MESIPEGSDFVNWGHDTDGLILQFFSKAFLIRIKDSL